MRLHNRVVAGKEPVGDFPPMALFCRFCKFCEKKRKKIIFLLTVMKIVVLLQCSIQLIH